MLKPNKLFIFLCSFLFIFYGQTQAGTANFGNFASCSGSTDLHAFDVKATFVFVGNIFTKSDEKHRFKKGTNSNKTSLLLD
jgi:hypothetical protein